MFPDEKWEIPLEPFVDLRLLPGRKGWTQTQAARPLGVKVRTLRSWERGERCPKPIVLRFIEWFIAQNQ